MRRYRRRRNRGMLHAASGMSDGLVAVVVGARRENGFREFKITCFFYG